MRNVLLLLLPSLFLAYPTYTQGQSIEQHSRVKVWYDDIPNGLQRLGALGLAVDHGTVKRDVWIETDLSVQEIAIAEENGFHCEVLIEDVAAYYVARSALPEDENAGGARDDCGGPPHYPVPANFELGSMAGFYTWQEMLDILDDMHAQYPGLISAKQSIGESLEERPIHMVRLSNAPDVEQGKPEVFYNALHHAREPGSLTQLIFFLWHLLENYGSDAEATYLLDHFELYVVPCVNPDGYVFNEIIEPEGGGMWRKNRRPNGGGSFGVDLNRNYGYEWGYDDNGSSSNPNSQVYRGPSPFSEPETQVLRDFCESRQFRLAMNNHTHGNLLIHPWGFIPSFFTPDSAVFAEYGAHLTEHNRYLHGTGDQTVNYVVNGGSDDWMYGEQDSKPLIYAMTPEAGRGSDGFWPSIARIVPISQDLMASNLRTAHLAGVYGQVRDRSPAILGAPTAHVAFEVMRLGQEPGDLTVSLEPLENVLSVGTPVTFAEMELLETRLDSITLSPLPSLAHGDPMRFVIAISNGFYTQRDTITKFFGAPLVLLAENGSSMDQWQSGSWDLSTTYWYSAPSSITDSPFGDYQDNTNSTITLAETIDLTDATAAVLTFMARWDIEAEYDFAQVLASADGFNWTPLCGRYTRPGTAVQDDGAPIYDGQRYTWVREEIPLTGFLGEELRLRFRMVSDENVERDGFYFDDLRVVKTAAIGTGLDELAPVQLVLAPNPATDYTWITWTGAQLGSGHLVIRDALGATVHEGRPGSVQGSIRVDTAKLPAGVYLVHFSDDLSTAPAMRLVVTRP